MADKKTWLHTLLYWLIALALITPLLATQHIFMGLAFLKAMAFFAVVELMLIVYLILVSQGRAQLPRLNWINWMFLGFLVVLGITTVFSIQPYVSFWGSSNRILGLVTWLHVGAFFYVLAGFLRQKEDWLKLLRIAIWASLPVVLYGLGQYLRIPFLAPSETVRVESTIGNPIFLAEYLIVLIPLTGLYTFFTKSRFCKWSFGAILVLQILVLLLTGSRGGMVALAVTIFVLLVSGAIIYRRKLFLWLIGICLILGGILVVGSNLASDSNLVRNNLILRRISEINLAAHSSQTRLLAWQQGIEAWKQRPWLGWGLENYSAADNLNYQPFMEQYSIRETWLDRAHNAFVDALVMTGVVGFLAYIVLLGTVLMMAWKMAYRSATRWHRMLGLATFTTALAYIAFVFFAFDTLSSLVYVVFLWAILSSQVGSETKFSASWAAIVLVPIIVFASYPFVVRNVIANKVMSNAITVYYQQDFDRAFKLVDRALSYNTFLDSSIRNKLMELGTDVYNQANQAGTRQLIEPYLAETAEIAENAIVKEPYSAFLYSKLLYTYVNLASWDASYISAAEKIFEKLVNMSPNRPNSYAIMGNLYIAAGKYELASIQYDRAIEIHPQWGELHYRKGVSVLAQGKTHEADESFVLALDLSYNACVLITDQIVDAIAGTMEGQGKWQMAESSRQRLIKRCPQNIRGYIDIAKFYFRRDQLDLAYDYLLQAFRLDYQYELTREPRELARELIVELNKKDSKYEIPNSI